MKKKSSWIKENIIEIVGTIVLLGLVIFLFQGWRLFTEEVDGKKCYSTTGECSCIKDCLNLFNGNFIKFDGGLLDSGKCFCEVKGEIKNIW